MPKMNQQWYCILKLFTIIVLLISFMLCILLFIGGTVPTDAKAWEYNSSLHKVHKTKQSTTTWNLRARFSSFTTQMLWRAWSGTYIKVWVSYTNDSPKVCSTVRDDLFSKWKSDMLDLIFPCNINLLVKLPGMDSFSRVSLQKIHLASLLQYFNSLISCQICTKLGTQNCFSERVRWDRILLILLCKS